MAIVSTPPGVDMAHGFFCAVCGRHIEAAQATVGMLGFDSKQAFACNSHFQSGSQYILGWTDFLLAGRAAIQDGDDDLLIHQTNTPNHAQPLR